MTRDTYAQDADAGVPLTRPERFISTTTAGVSIVNPAIDAGDDVSRIYGVGRKGEATARVWMKPGSGKVVVNGRDRAAYFPQASHQAAIERTFFQVGATDKYDVVTTVKGGTLATQALAVSAGIKITLSKADVGKIKRGHAVLAVKPKWKRIG